MAWNVTTEWEDIHVKLKNYLPKEKDPTGEQMEKLAIETAERFDPLENKTLDELKIMEEDNDEDEEIRRYKEMRLAEMKEFAKKPKFGKVAEIRKQDYLSEVNNAPKDVFVVLHLYQDCVEECMILNEIFNYLSRKFILVKFLKIVANNCVENFSDSDCPAVFIYFNGKPIKQFLRANYYFGGKNMNWKKVEWILNSLGVVKSDLIEDPFDEEGYKVSMKEKKKNDDESSDEEREDRQYLWQIVKKKKL